jgi:protein SCO1/2
MQVLSKCESQHRMALNGRRDLVLRAALAAQASLFLFGMALAAAAHGNPATSASQSQSVGIEQHLNNQVPLDLKFRDETGRTVILGSYFGKSPVILSMVYYTCPMMCTEEEHGLVNALRDVQFNIGDQYQVVTVSFDPREKPELAMGQKTIYVGLYGRPGAKQGWHFLVGDDSSIHSLTQAVGFHYQYMRDIDIFSHPTGIVVLTPKGKVSSYFYGIQYPAQGVHLALVDASNEKIASPEDINRRLQKGIAGGGTSQVPVDSTMKPRAGTPTVDHLLSPAAAGTGEKQ